MADRKLTAWPDFFPPERALITSRSAGQFARRYRRAPIELPSLRRTVQTAYVPPTERRPTQPPVCFLHGFDSSSFDFRKLLPYVEAKCEPWSVDLIGWGFSDHSLFLEEPFLPNGPETKREHLYAFWRRFIQRPMHLMGVSLGGAVAIDFALHYPGAVEGLILSSAQGYTDGLGMLSRVPSFVARLGVRFLQTETLRRVANDMAYHDRSIDVEQAMQIGRLHTLLPGGALSNRRYGIAVLGWTEASLAFIRSDGYSVSSRIREIDVPTLILWGREDRVLGTETAARFRADVRDSELCWIEDCGHAGHLECHTQLGDALVEFVRRRSG